MDFFISALFLDEINNNAREIGLKKFLHGVNARKKLMSKRNSCKPDGVGKSRETTFLMAGPSILLYFQERRIKRSCFIVLTAYFALK